MSSVRKRILPSGELRWLLDYKDQAGQRRAKQFRTKSEAVAFETKVRSEIASGVHVADLQASTVRQAADLWLQRARLEGLEASTIRQYRQHVEHHIEPLIGSLKLTRLTTPVVEEFRDKLLETRSRALSRAILASLKAILVDALRRGLVGQNAAANTKIKDANREKEKVEIPTKDEIRGILNKSAELWPLTRQLTWRGHEDRVVAQPWRPMILTAIFTGLRLSELRGLPWEHVDFSEGVIRVRQRADFQNKMGPPKSEAGARDVPMAPILLNTLRTWKIACPLSPQKLVFPTKTGGVISTSNTHRQCWRPLLKELGLVDVSVDDTGEEVEETRYTFHCLRHTAAEPKLRFWPRKKILRNRRYPAGRPTRPLRQF